MLNGYTVKDIRGILKEDRRKYLMSVVMFVIGMGADNRKWGGLDFE